MQLKPVKRSPVEGAIRLFAQLNIACVAVYLLEEVWQTMQNSGPDTAAGFVEYVNKRLAHKSPVVKQRLALSFL